MTRRNRRKPPAVTTELFLSYVREREAELNFLHSLELETLAVAFNLITPTYA